MCPPDLWAHKMICCWWDQQERGNVTASGFIRAPIKTVAPFYFVVSMCHRSRCANISYPLHLLPRRACPPLRRPIDSLFIFHFPKRKAPAQWGHIPVATAHAEGKHEDGFAGHRVCPCLHEDPCCKSNEGLRDYLDSAGATATI